jgi:hypothetical protein
MTGFILLQAFLVLFLYSRQLFWLETAIGLVSFDGLVGVLLLVVGIRQLKGPYMVETIAQFSKTTAMLLEEER